MSQSQIQFSAAPAPELDSMLTREQAAQWLNISEEDLAGKSRGEKPKIPAFKPSKKMVRYHPRTIISVLARRAGVPTDLIAASFGITEQKGNQN